MMKTTDIMILVVNTGSTSTKLAVYKDGDRLFEQSLDHTNTELEQYKSILDQVGMRKSAVIAFIEEKGLNIAYLDVIASRGGSFAVVEGGGYVIDETIMELAGAARPGFRVSPSWLAALISGQLSREFEIPAYFYNAVRTDEMCPLARYSGISLVERRPAGHPLNCKEIGRRSAEKMGKKFEDSSFIVCHMGGGISTELHYKGRFIDCIGYPEGAFTPERAGAVPTNDMLDLCFSGEHTQEELEKYLRGSGGLVDYLGTNSTLEVQKRISGGDSKAEEVYRAMAYQIAKGIGALAATVKGDVDRILLTGGIAGSDLFTGWIIEYVQFIAPVEVYPGTYEMEALAHGILRVYRGEETAKVYTKT